MFSKIILFVIIYVFVNGLIRIFEYPPSLQNIDCDQVKLEFKNGSLVGVDYSLNDFPDCHLPTNSKTNPCSNQLTVSNLLLRPVRVSAIEHDGTNVCGINTQTILSNNIFVFKAGKCPISALVVLTSINEFTVQYIENDKQVDMRVNNQNRKTYTFDGTSETGIGIENFGNSGIVSFI